MTLDRSHRRPGAYAKLGLGLAAAGVVLWAPGVQAKPQAPAGDPWQGLNRKTYAFSMGLDRVLIGPIAKVYLKIVPAPIRDRVSSAVYNLGEPNTAMNLALQGHPKAATCSATRFVVNSTVGVLGLFDVAAKTGLKRREADFGQTFGRYGAGTGPYVYVPVMGPSNVRDGTGRILDIVTDPVGLVYGGLESRFGRERLGVTVLDTRAQYDPAFNALKDTIDPYAAVRSAYDQRREAFVLQSRGEAEVLPDFDPEPATTPEQEAAPDAATPQ